MRQATNELLRLRAELIEAQRQLSAAQVHIEQLQAKVKILRTPNDKYRELTISLANLPEMARDKPEHEQYIIKHAMETMIALRAELDATKKELKTAIQRHFLPEVPTQAPPKPK